MQGKRHVQVTPIRPAEDLAALAGLVLETLAEVRAIKSLLARQRTPYPPETAARLLEAIYDAVRERPFVSRELMAYAELPQGKDLREAIVAAVGSLNAKSLGKLLRKIVGHQLGPYCVSRSKDERAGAIWQVQRVCGSETLTPTPERTAGTKL